MITVPLPQTSHVPLRISYHHYFNHPNPHKLRILNLQHPILQPLNSRRKMEPKSEMSVWERCCHFLGVRKPRVRKKKTALDENEELQKEDSSQRMENTSSDLTISNPAVPSELQEEAGCSEEMQPNTETFDKKRRSWKKLWYYLICISPLEYDEETECPEKEEQKAEESLHVITEESSPLREVQKENDEVQSQQSSLEMENMSFDLTNAATAVNDGDTVVLEMKPKREKSLLKRWRHLLGLRRPKTWTKKTAPDDELQKDNSSLKTEDKSLDRSTSYSAASELQGEAGGAEELQPKNRKTTLKRFVHFLSFKEMKETEGRRKKSRQTIESMHRLVEELSTRHEKQYESQTEGSLERESASCDPEAAASATIELQDEDAVVVEMEQKREARKECHFLGLRKPKAWNIKTAVDEDEELQKEEQKMEGSHQSVAGELSTPQGEDDELQMGDGEKAGVSEETQPKSERKRWSHSLDLRKLKSWEEKILKEILPPAVFLSQRQSKGGGRSDGW